EGKDLTLMREGHKYKEARDAEERLRSRGVDCGLVNLRYLKPLREEALADILHRSPRVVTIEEGVLDGGVGSAIATFVADRRIKCGVLGLGVECGFITPGAEDELCPVQQL